MGKTAKAQKAGWYTLVGICTVICSRIHGLYQYSCVDGASYTQDSEARDWLMRIGVHKNMVFDWLSPHIKRSPKLFYSPRMGLDGWTSVSREELHTNREGQRAKICDTLIWKLSDEAIEHVRIY